MDQSLHTSLANKENLSKKSLKSFLQKKYIKLLLFSALTGAGVFSASEKITFNDQKNTEQISDSTAYPFQQHHLAFWDDNADFFTQDLQLKKETLAPGVEVVRDAGLTFYVVQAEDFKEKKDTIYISKSVKVKHGKKTGTKKIQVPKIIISKIGDFEKIRNKLSNIAEFAYLKDEVYDRSKAGNKVRSFNIPAENIEKGMHIPIPLDHKVREISPQDFANYCHEAINEMKSDDSKYAKEFKEIFSHTSEQDLVIDMIAFARSETASDFSGFIKPLGDVELHRREPKYKALSISYFHILMEKNPDKTPGPGLAARLKLGLTEGQCYHPKNAVKLFLAYRIEKTNGNLKNIFPLTDNNIENVAKTYNGSKKYTEKLEANYLYAKKLLRKEIVYYNDENLKNNGFIDGGLNSKYQHTYKYVTPHGVYNNDVLKKTIIEQFNQNKSPDCPKIDENDVFTQSGKSLEGEIIPDTVVIKLSNRK